MQPAQPDFGSMLGRKKHVVCRNVVECIRGCPWKLVTIVSKLVYNLHNGRIQPTYIGVIIHLLSTMDIPVC